MEFRELKKLIVKCLLEEATEEESRLLEQWCATSDSNKRLYEKLSSELFLKKAITDKNKELCKTEWKKLEAKTCKRKGRLSYLSWGKVAAAVCILGLGIVSVGLWQRQNTIPGEHPSNEKIQAGSSRAIVELAGGKQFFFDKDTTYRLEAQGIELVSTKDTLEIIPTADTYAKADEYHLIRIPNGGEYIARLEDGSIVHLNAGSELKVPVRFGSDNREVWLKGEAFFEVVHHEKLVFTVHTGQADISVLGTQFDVRAYADEKEIVTTLVQGAVQVVSGNSSGRLMPGEQARVSEPGQVAVSKVDVYPYVAWKSGRMVFENERLEKIMTELQRWYDFELFYANPEVKDMRFTIDILKYDEISKVLNLMERMHKVKFTQKGRTVVLTAH